MKLPVGATTISGQVSQSLNVSLGLRQHLTALEAEAPDPARKTPDVLSPSDPAAAWTAKARLQVQFAYGLNYLIDIDNAIIVDVEATPAGSMMRCAQQERCSPVQSAAWNQARAAGGRHRLWHGWSDYR